MIEWKERKREEWKKLKVKYAVWFSREWLNVNTPCSCDRIAYHICMKKKLVVTDPLFFLLLIQMANTLHISQHPIVAAKVSQLREANQPPKAVREIIRDLSTLLGYEASTDLKLTHEKTVKKKRRLRSIPTKTTHSFFSWWVLTHLILHASWRIASLWFLFYVLDLALWMVYLSTDVVSFSHIADAGFLSLFPDAPVLHLGLYREKVCCYSLSPPFFFILFWGFGNLLTIPVHAPTGWVL